jgi:hypothetical protein
MRRRTMSTQKGLRHEWTPLLRILAGGACLVLFMGAHRGAVEPAMLPKGPAIYALVPDSSENIKIAIDSTVRHMSFIIRGIARSRLSKINPTPQRLRVDVEADTASVGFDNGNPVVTPLNGETVSWLNPLTGETDHAHAAVSGDTVRQTIVAHDGQRENALVFSEDGQRLRLHVTVTSHRLPRPLVYDLLFRKVDT